MKILKETPTELILRRTNLEVKFMLITIPIVALIGTLIMAGLNAQTTTASITCERDSGGLVRCQRKLDLMQDLPKYTRAVDRVKSANYETRPFGLPGFMNVRLLLINSKDEEISIYSAIIYNQDLLKITHTADQINAFLQSQSSSLKIQRSFDNEFKLSLLPTGLWMTIFFGLIWLFYSYQPLKETLTLSCESNCLRRQFKSLLGKTKIAEHPLDQIRRLEQQQMNNAVGPHPVIVLTAAPDCHLLTSSPTEVTATIICIQTFLSANHFPHFLA